MATPTEYRDICEDVWHEIAKHIAPEDIGSFSLICTKSAVTIDNFQFWCNIYRRFCYGNTSTLPDYLTHRHFEHCNKVDLRQRVTRALFYCYPPFKLRLENRFSLDILIGRNLVTQYYKNNSEVCMRFLLFKQTFPLFDNPWLISSFGLDCEFNVKECTNARDCDGLIGLDLRCDRFISFPYGEIHHDDGNTYTLTAYRASDPITTVLKEIELDFMSSDSREITVKFSYLQNYTVLPWWHPKFSHF